MRLVYIIRIVDTGRPEDKTSRPEIHISKRVHPDQRTISRGTETIEGHLGLSL